MINDGSSRTRHQLSCMFLATTWRCKLGSEEILALDSQRTISSRRKGYIYFNLGWGLLGQFPPLHYFPSNYLNQIHILNTISIVHISAKFWCDSKHPVYMFVKPEYSLTWTTADIWLIKPLGLKPIDNRYFFQESISEIVCKMAAILFRPHCADVIQVSWWFMGLVAYNNIA